MKRLIQISCVALALCAAAGAAAGGSGRATVTDKDFAKQTFSDAATIDNRWLPLKPGTQFIYRGRANRGHGLTRHRVVFTVTDLTKVIAGVRTLVIWDRDFNGGRLAEGELAFHAQDDNGNVWNFGEYPEEWAHGRVTGAPDSWLAGSQRARAGVLMRAEPRRGAPTYLQGWAPRIEFSDGAKVLSTHARTCVPLRCYRNVLVTEEWNAVERGAHQFKYYAAGVGNIRVGAEKDTEAEQLVLVKVVHLGPRALTRVRREALKLDRRAARIRKDLFGDLAPASAKPHPPPPTSRGLRAAGGF